MATTTRKPATRGPKVTLGSGPAPRTSRRRTTSQHPPEPPPPPTDVVVGFAGAEPDDEELKDAPVQVRARVAEVADELADAGHRGAGRRGKATEADWEEFLGALLGYGSMLFAWWLVAGTGSPRSARNELELTDAEASGMARPLARILARSFINAKYGKSVLGASDYIVLAVVVTGYAERVAPAIRRKAGNAFTRAPRPAKEAPRDGQLEAAPPGPAGPVVLGAQFT